MDFVGGRGAMFHAARHDHEFAFAEIHACFSSGFVAVVHAETAMKHEEHLVLELMVMPDEVALKLHQLHQLTVEFANDFRLPMLLESIEFLGDPHLLHVWLRYASGSTISMMGRNFPESTSLAISPSCAWFGSTKTPADLTPCWAASSGDGWPRIDTRMPSFFSTFHERSRVWPARVSNTTSTSRTTSSKFVLV